MMMIKSMMCRASFGCCLLVAAGAGTCSAQVIQLPTFHFFSISTTVSVPDRGAAYLGGVRRAQYGTSSQGVPGLNKVPGLSRLFSNRGSGSSVSSSDAWVTATIIDHAEMDALLLGEAAGRRPPPVPLSETDRKALALSAHIGRAAPGGALRIGVGARDEAPLESVAAIRSRHDAAARQHLAEMQEYWERGQRAELDDRLGVARVCYDIVARRGSGELRDRALASLARLRARTRPANPDNRSSSNVVDPEVGAAISPAARTLSAATATGSAFSGESNRLP